VENFMMKAALTTALLLLALNASAACPVKRPGSVPALPDGASASQKQMREARLAVESYVLQAEAYMDCGVMNRRQYTALDAQLEILSELYNEEMVEFQVRKNMLAEN
jgi:hypothetical protein